MCSVFDSRVRSWGSATVDRLGLHQFSFSRSNQVTLPLRRLMHDVKLYIVVNRWVFPQGQRFDAVCTCRTIGGQNFKKDAARLQDEQSRNHLASSHSTFTAIGRRSLPLAHNQ